MRCAVRISNDIYVPYASKCELVFVFRSFAFDKSGPHTGVDAKAGVLLSNFKTFKNELQKAYQVRINETIHIMKHRKVEKAMCLAKYYELIWKSLKF